MSMLLGMVGGAAASPLLTDLAAYYPLSDLTDALGGTSLTNNNTATFVTGKVGNAVNLVKASNQYLSIASGGGWTFAGLSWTIAMWFKMTTEEGGTNTLLSKYGVSNAAQEVFVLYDQSSSAVQLSIYNGAGANTTITFAEDLSANVWHCVMVWLDNAAHVIYVQLDNQIYASQGSAVTIAAGSHQVEIGSTQAAPSWNLNGIIDELGKWNRVLTAVERATFYNGGYGNTYPNFAINTALPVDWKLLQDGKFISFPILVRFASGAWRVYVHSGAGDGVAPMKVKQWSSSNGDLWVPEAHLYSHATVYANVTAVLELANGNTLRFDVLESGGNPPTTFVPQVSVSTNLGATWGAAAGITNPLSDWFHLYGKAWQLAGGRILLSAYGENTGEHTRSILLKSDDNGATFTLLSTIAYDGVIDFNETSIVNTGGSNWLAMIRTNGFTYYTRSTDDGATWGALTSIGITWQSPELAYDGSGNLFVFYRSNSNTAVAYRKSTDDGATWGSEQVLYQGANTVNGYPSAVYTSDGYFRVAYYRDSAVSAHVWKQLAASM